MQVFIVGTPEETARVLDSKRLNKQIIECGQILDALKGAKAWSNHPGVLQYSGQEFWLRCYKRVLESFIKKDNIRIRFWNWRASESTPQWHTQEYYYQIKRRLYTEDTEYYKQWAHLGTSDENWYWSEREGAFIKYVNGKRL